MKKYLGFTALILTFISHAGASPYLPEPRDEKAVKTLGTADADQKIRLHGNLHYTDEKIQKILDFPEGTAVPEDQIKESVDRLHTFYQNEGYALAQVKYEKDGEGWLIRIEEGTLSAINISGLGWHATYVMRNTILPNDIYNESRLEEALVQWAQKKWRYDIRWELQVMGKDAKKPFAWAVGFVRKLLPTSRTLRALQAGGVYNLFIYFVPKPETTLAYYDMEYTIINGLKLDGEFKIPGLLVDNDRLFLGARFDFIGHKSVDPARNNNEYFFSGGGRVGWFTPPLGVDWLRLGLEGQYLHLSQQRPDLPLDRYRVNDVLGNLKLKLEPTKTKKGSLYVGYSYKDPYSTTTIPSAPPTPTLSKVKGLVGGATWEQTFGALYPDPRLNHVLALHTWVSLRQNERVTYLGQATYRKVFQSSWLDVELGGIGTLLEGHPEVYEEIPLHEFANRAHFDRRFFARRLLTQRTEFRLNLHERKLQLGIFNDASLFGTIDRTSGNQDAAFNDGFGPLLNLVIYDAFYFSFAYARGESTETGTTHDFFFGVDKAI